jgi:hypothetical protein
MMITPSQTIETSGRMCVDRITVCWPASDRISERISAICLGSSPMVEDEQLGVAQERLGQADALAVALGQLADQAAAHVRDEAPLHHLVHLRPPLSPAHALDLRHELQVCAHREVRVEGGVLGQVADAPPHLQRLAEDVESGHPRAATGRRHEAREDLHGGGLPGAVRPEKADDLALVDAERDVGHGRDGPVTLGEMFDLNHRGFGWLS